jgi:hypothetical protein
VGAISNADLDAVTQAAEDLLDQTFYGFALDLVGFLCDREHEWDDSQVCPFNPGCGAKSYADCPLMKRRALITNVSKRKQ